VTALQRLGRSITAAIIQRRPAYQTEVAMRNPLRFGSVDSDLLRACSNFADGLESRQNPMKIEGPITTLLFDWDGTLFDSASAGFTAFQRTFADLGITFTREIYEACYSPNWYAMYETLSLPKDRWKMADELWLEHYGEQPPRLVEKAGETIHALGERGYRLGIVTSGTERRVTREIQQLSLSSTFEALICNEHIVNKKPHPEGLEKAMQLLGIATDTCSYVGDAPEDVRMGKNAGMLTVAVCSAYPTSRRLREEQPDIHLESIDELLLHF
jgi:HAD superfamily hydrolase (TIGR01509 family)